MRQDSAFRTNVGIYNLTEPEMAERLGANNLHARTVEASSLSRLGISASILLTFMFSPDGNLSGLPEFYTASLPACHGLWTPADLHTLALTGASVLPSVEHYPLGVRNKLISKLYQHFRVRVTPAAYRILCLRFARLVRRSFDSATDARLNTGGWLPLTRRGLSPRKMQRALLGAKCHQLSDKSF